MNTTDTRAAFEVWHAKEFGWCNTESWSKDGEYTDAVMQTRWHAYQAATEAAKATGTAGELSDYVLMPRCLTAENGAKSLLIGEFKESVQVPCPECHDEDEDYACETCENFGTVAQDVPVGWDTIKRIYAMAVEHLSLAEAARQPAPALPVKTWQERMEEDGHEQALSVYCRAEIADLRAALAATAAPVLSDDERDAFENLYHALPDILPSAAYKRMQETGKWAKHSAWALRGHTGTVEYRADDMATVYECMDRIREIIATRSQP